jgi:hypothetical protein
MINKSIFNFFLISLFVFTIHNKSINNQTLSPLDRKISIYKNLKNKIQDEEKEEVDKFDPAVLTALALTGLNNRNKPIIIKVITKYGNHSEEFIF